MSKKCERCEITLKDDDIWWHNDDHYCFDCYLVV